MDTAPEVGQRVRYRVEFGNHVVREVTGRVVSVHRHFVYDDHDELVVCPDQRTWKVSVVVDHKPRWWPYGSTLVFCPSVNTLTPEDAPAASS